MTAMTSTSPTAGPPPAVSVPPPRRAVHIPALDGLRGIAILLVAVFHFSHATHDDHAAGFRLVVQKFTGAGWVGVDLFFVLSGFLITSILYDAKASAGYFKNFYMRRVLRIFPLYYGVLVVALVVLPLLRPYASPLQREIVGHQAYLWLYLQNFFHITRWGGFAHFWSLAVEEQFYLVWPAVVFLFGRRALVRICVGVIVAALLIRIGWLNWQPVLAPLLLNLIHWLPVRDSWLTWLHSPAISNFALVHSIYYATFCRMDALAVGALLALAAHAPGGVAALARPAAGVAAVAGGLVGGLFLWNRGLWYGTPSVQTGGYTLLAVFFGAVLVLAIVAPPGGLPGRVLTSRLLRFFGKYSYGFYVFHGLLVPWVAVVLPAKRLAPVLGSYIGVTAIHVVAGTLLSTAAAVVSWHLYEKHFLKLKRCFEYRVPTLEEPVGDGVVPPPAVGLVAGLGLTADLARRPI